MFNNRYRIMKSALKSGKCDTMLCIVYSLQEAETMVSELRKASNTSIYYYENF